MAQVLFVSEKYISWPTANRFETQGLNYGSTSSSKRGELILSQVAADSS